jgi:nucleoid-associated protein YgaU
VKSTFARKLIVVAALSGLATVAGCKKNNTPPPAPAPTADLNPPQPAPFIPQSSPGVTVGPSIDPAPAPMVTPGPTVVAPAPVETVRRAPAAAAGSVRVGGTYTVVRGDTLGHIAKRAYGSASKRNIDAIKRANGLKSDVIRVGQKLKIPALGGSGNKG